MGWSDSPLIRREVSQKFPTKMPKKDVKICLLTAEPTFFCARLNVSILTVFYWFEFGLEQSIKTHHYKGLLKLVSFFLYFQTILNLQRYYVDKHPIQSDYFDQK
jgi:phosphate starvation-inducible membrane PsiE